MFTRSNKMKYCSKCKKLYNNDTLTHCADCSRRLISDPHYSSPVRLVTANGFEFERIRAAIDSAEIPYSYQEAKNDTGIQILNSAPPENCDIFVPLNAYRDAVDILIGIGALNDVPVELSEQDINKLKDDTKKAKEEELPEDKARLIRILSIIAFLIVLAGVAFATDALTGWIKSLIGM